MLAHEHVCVSACTCITKFEGAACAGGAKGVQAINPAAAMAASFSKCLVFGKVLLAIGCVFTAVFLLDEWQQTCLVLAQEIARFNNISI